MLNSFVRITEFSVKYQRGKRYCQIKNEYEWLFPGFNHVDGTVEGAMKAGMEAYP